MERGKYNNECAVWVEERLCYKDLQNGEFEKWNLLCLLASNIYLKYSKIVEGCECRIHGLGWMVDGWKLFFEKPNVHFRMEIKCERKTKKKKNLDDRLFLLHIQYYI